ncbi:hypothetical protein EXH46_13600 [Pelomonas puraquae]|uniref:Uncharacterized protein n=1 Tax=Roseateles puraquae TaxID=431059 RepID=A0A254NH71_9BURK|nr:hypothetical protein [Roseateles puraquae]OWR04608.1 hypothetical protein CDO81_08480 [Roseateles puraquae]
MARGESGRIVIEVDPALKRELYAALALSGSTLKDWFIRSAGDYCTSGVQGSLFAPVVSAAGAIRNETDEAVQVSDEAQTESAE